MILYLVGVDKGTMLGRPDKLPLLNSYWYLRRGKSKKAMPAEEVRDRVPCSSLFIDSGAFSAYNMKLTVDFDAYVQYLHENRHHIDVYACLDVIGDPEATYKNFKEMRRQGLEPLPVFHCRSDIKWLHKFLDEEGCPYIAIGGIAGDPQLRNAFFTRVMPVMVDEDGQPRVKFHAFGMTDVRYMRMFPWHSVDSASWALIAGFGNVFYVLPDGRYGVLGVSDQSPARKALGRKHIDRIPVAEQKLFMAEFKRYGFRLEDLRSRAKYRRPWNVLMSQRIAELITSEKVAFKNAQDFFV